MFVWESRAFWHWNVSCVHTGQTILFKILLKRPKTKKQCSTRHQSLSGANSGERETVLKEREVEGEWVAVGVAVLLAAEVERGREKQPLCSSDMKATGCDRMNHQTAGHSSSECFTFSHKEMLTCSHIYWSHRSNVSTTMALSMVTKSVICHHVARLWKIPFCCCCLYLGIM